MVALLPPLRKRGSRKGLEKDEKEENMVGRFWSWVLFFSIRYSDYITGSRTSGSVVLWLEISRTDWGGSDSDIQ